MRFVRLRVLPGQGIRQIGIAQDGLACRVDEEPALPQPPESRLSAIAGVRNVAQECGIFLAGRLHVTRNSFNFSKTLKNRSESWRFPSFGLIRVYSRPFAVGLLYPVHLR